MFRSSTGIAQLVGGLPGHVLVRGAVEPVLVDLVLGGQVGPDRVRPRRLRQAGEEGGVEDGDVRYVEAGPGRADPGHGRRVVQRSQGTERLDLGQHAVVDDHRVGEVGTTVHDPVADRGDADLVQIGTVRGELLPQRGQGGAVIGHGDLHHVALIGDRVRDPSGRLTDLLDQPGRQHLGGVGHDQLVLQRRRTGVDHQHRSGGTPAHAALPAALPPPPLPAPPLASMSFPAAWTAVIATVFTMSSTRAPRERSLTGLRRPCSTGPIATA